VHLGDRLVKLRKLAGLTQEQVAERAGVSVDVIRKLEQHRKHSARLPTLHALARGLGVEVMTLLGDPPAVASNGAPEPPTLVGLRRAVMPSPVPRPPDLNDLGSLSLSVLRQEIADGWSLYHDADFGGLITVLPGIIADARLLATVGTPDQKAAGTAALGKALQLAGHLSIRLGETDLALSAPERAAAAADDSGDPLLAPMIRGSVAWAYQRQNRLDDAEEPAVTAADNLERDSLDTAAHVRVWGGLLMSAATSVARMGNYDKARDVMIAAEAEQDGSRCSRRRKTTDGSSRFSVARQSGSSESGSLCSTRGRTRHSPWQRESGSAPTSPRPGGHGCCWTSRGFIPM